MKIILSSTFAFMAITIMSCSTSRQYPPSYPNDRQQQPRVIIVNDDSRNLPPGHAKKIYGKKCAKYYAPGWCKHHNKRYKYRPTVIISIPLNLATRANNGRYFYDDDMGYRYWRGNDNDERFYLDNQHNNDACYCNLGYDDNDNRYNDNDRRDDHKGKHKGKGKEKKHKHHDRDDD